MAETIRCPGCGDTIEVTEVLAAQLRTEVRREFENEFRGRETELARTKADIAAQHDALAAQRSQLDQEIAERLQIERAKLENELLAKARQSIDLEFKDMRAQLAEARRKIDESQQTELDLRRQKRELEDSQRNLELEVQRQLDQQREDIRNKAKNDAGEEYRLKVAEKDEMIRGLREQIEALMRKSEQGSQQLQGEVLELEFESILRREFPFDEIAAVPKGIHGGDILQSVRDTSGRDCGTILWETKRAKNWNNEWIAKLRKDQFAAKAHIAILVSDELPKMVSTFSYIEPIWVANRACCIALAIALRNGILDMAGARRALEGQQGKMELLYEYLSSSAFRNRVSGIVEAFMTLRRDLEAERRAVQRQWAKREQQINHALLCTSGMYGDLQGIIGGTLPTIPPLELPAPANAEEDGELLATGAALPR